MPAEVHLSKETCAGLQRMAHLTEGDACFLFLRAWLCTYKNPTKKQVLFPFQQTEPHNPVITGLDILGAGKWLASLSVKLAVLVRAQYDLLVSERWDAISV